MIVTEIFKIKLDELIKNKDVKKITFIRKDRNTNMVVAFVNDFPNEMIYLDGWLYKEEERNIKDYVKGV